MRLDRRLGKLGRWAGESYADTPEQFDAINQMLTELKKSRDWDKLALIVNRVMRPVDLYEALNRGDELPTGDEGRNLEVAVNFWLDNADLAEATKFSYRRVLTPLFGKTVCLGDLPAKLKRESSKALHTGKRRNFNICRSAALSLLTSIVDDQHRLYRAVRRIPELEETPRTGNPQTVEQIRDIAALMGVDGPQVWDFCLTGMRKAEYFERPWKAHADRVRIVGVKGSGIREVPLVHPLTGPRVGYSRFYHRLTDVTDGAVIVHDLRKTYMTWLEEVGVARIRRRIYLGHKVKDVSELYERKDVTAYLAKDAERLREFVGGPPRAGLKLESA